MLHRTSDSSFLRRCVPLAMVAALACGASTAQAKTQHHYSSIIQNMPLSTSNGYPGVGGTAILAGTWSTNLYGNGALLDYVTITGHPAPSKLTFKGTEVGFVAQGTFRDTFTGTDTVRPDGGQIISSKGRITGGTGAFRGARGTFKFSGSTLPGSTGIGGHSTGTVRY